LTDSKGRTVDFKNTVLIMTSNIGSSLLLEGVEDDGSINPETAAQVRQLLRQHFKPEFLNRIDDTVLFTPLAQSHMNKIVFKLLKSLQERLAYQDISLELDDQAATWLAHNGYDPVYGARPLMRYMTRELETPLAKAIIAGDIQANSHVMVHLEDDHLVFESKPNQE
jgi:chaperone protein clpB